VIRDERFAAGLKFQRNEKGHMTNRDLGEVFLVVATIRAAMQDFEMSSSDVATLALDLPPEERLELARRLVESVVTPGLNTTVQEGIRRIEDILAGKTKGLTEAEFRAALG
jgi:hypothetical protein